MNVCYKYGVWYSKVLRIVVKRVRTWLRSSVNEVPSGGLERELNNSESWVSLTRLLPADPEEGQRHEYYTVWSKVLMFRSRC